MSCMVLRCPKGGFSIPQRGGVTVAPSLVHSLSVLQCMQFTCAGLGGFMDYIT